MKPIFQQVSIVGLGLIGGSLGLALRRGGIARKVIGFSRSEATLKQALRRKAIHDGDTELCHEWLGQSDLVVIATPPEKVVPIAKQIAKITSGKILLTDVASTKAEIVRALEGKLPSRVSFVGGHPMAGSEQSGIGAADASLFKGAVCILTRTGKTSSIALGRVAKLWKAVGSRIETMTPVRHDALVAQISHLPHLAAAALTLVPESAALKLAGGGFLDTTRIALSDPEMWDQICRMNRREINSSLDKLIRQLKQFKGSVGPQLAAARSRRRSLTGQRE